LSLAFQRKTDGSFIELGASIEQASWPKTHHNFITKAFFRVNYNFNIVKQWFKRANAIKHEKIADMDINELYNNYFSRQAKQIKNRGYYEI
jgi:hypothetical protein